MSQWEIAVAESGGRSRAGSAPPGAESRRGSRPHEPEERYEDVPRVSTRDMWTAGRVLGFRRLGRRLWQRIYDYDLFGHAAELAYFFLLSVFPLLLFLVSLFGYIAEAGELRSELFDYVSRISPSGDVTGLLRDTLSQIIERRSGGKLSFGLLVSLWVASYGMAAIGRSLNTAYHLKETRPWLIQQLWAVVLVIFTTVLVTFSLLLVLFGQRLNDYLVQSGVLGVFLGELMGLLQWLVISGLVIFAFEVIYNFAPAVWQRRHLWLTPGAVVAVLLWVGVSLGLRTYLQWGHESDRGYGLLYGSLGTVISLMLWFYLSAAATLLGGVMNGEILQALREESGEVRTAVERVTGGRDGEKEGETEVSEEPGPEGAGEETGERV